MNTGDWSACNHASTLELGPAIYESPVARFSRPMFFEMRRRAAMQPCSHAHAHGPLHVNPYLLQVRHHVTSTMSPLHGWQ